MSSLSHTSPTPSKAIPPLEHPLDEGWTLQASWYSDAAVAALERERIFARTWQYGGPAEQAGFSKVIDVDPDAYALTVSTTFSSQIGPVRASALNGKASVPFVPVGEVKQSQYHFLWPNTTVNIAPGPANISLERWVPDGIGRTIEVTDYWFGADVPAEIVEEILEWDDQVGREDTDLVV
jgi:choline monooxygenase